VVLALQDRLAYAPTFEAALSSLFGGGISSLSGSESSTAPAAANQLAGSPTSAPQAKQDLNELITEAGKDFDDYQRLTAAGKLAEAGQKLEALKQTIEKLNAHAR